MCIDKVGKISFHLKELRKDLSVLKVQPRGGKISTLYEVQIEIGFGPGPSRTSPFCRDSQNSYSEFSDKVYLSEY